MRWWLLLSWLLVTPVHAQQVIQIPSCGNGLPSSINPSAPTITVNPSGQVCVLSGAISVVVPTPTVAIPSPQSVTIYPGNDVTEGSPSDAVAPNPTANSSVISLLKGIMTNVLSPLNVTGSFSTTVSSPLGVNIASSPVNVTLVGSPVQVQGTFSASPTTTVNINSITPTPLNVTISGSPQTINGNVGINGIPPVNIEQVQSQNIASPSTYGVAPVGSVQGVNAFVTSLPGTPLGVAIAGPTPLNVTVGNVASPQGVAVVNNVAVTPPTPLNVTLVASPLNTTLVTIPGSPIGTILTNSTVAISTSPVTVSIASSPVNVTGSFSTTVTSPLGVTPFSAASPQNVTFAASPVSVAISTVSSPVNVTGSLSVAAASPQNVNLDQINGQLIASPQTYGVANVGSVMGVNAFVTNNVNVTNTPAVSPANVTVGNSPTVVLSGSPVSVGIAGPTPLNVTVGNFGSPQNVTLSGPTPLNVTLVAIPGSPQNVTIATPAYVTQSLVPSSVGIITWTATPVNSITGTVLQVQASPISLGVHQLGKIVCDGQAASTWGFVQLFDAASTGAVTLGKTVPKETVPIAPGSINGFVNPLPGDGFTQGIFLAATTTPGGSTGIGTLVNCSVSYN